MKKLEERSGSRIRQYPLPQSTYDQFAAARPQNVQGGHDRATTTIEENIGPTKLEDDKLWFGKSFYDGEGWTGVGGFGYFGTSDGKYHLFAPPELADWSVSAIEMSQDNIWMALAHNGEWGGGSGGLARYDRHAGTLRHFECPDIALQFILVGEKLLAATDLGIVLLEGDQLKRFFIDRTTNGRLRVAPAIR